MRHMPDNQQLASHSSMWSPLRYSAFRSIWIAVTISNTGTWMHDMGVGWLMATMTDSSFMIALVQTATTLPFFLLALPAGTLADIVERRVFLLYTLTWMMMSAALLGILTLYGLTTPWILLGLTFSLGVGNAMMRPALSASVPGLVPRAELRKAITLNSMSLNVSRSAGPVLAGFVILSAGPAYVFLLNTLSFLAIMYAIYRWPISAVDESVSLPVERFMGGMRAGLRYAQNAPMLQAVLIKGVVFFFFSSAIWALLPVIAVKVLNGGPTLYGWLIAMIGIGAVVASQMMGWLNRKFSRNAIITAGGMLYAVTLFGFGNSTEIIILFVVLFFCGASWLALFSTIVVAGQLAVPDWVRARGLALVMLTMMGSMSVGSALWGQLADQLGIPMSCTIAAIGLALCLFLVRNVHIGEDDHIDLTPSMHWPTPEFADDIRPDSGPVMVTVEYTVGTENRDEFLRLSRQLKQLRKRDGAFFWEMYSRAGKANCLVEVFMVSSWLDHLRQHARVTVVDKELQDKLRSLIVKETRPKRSHFIA
jgi:MFS family permease